MSFKIEKGNLPTTEDTIFLKGYGRDKGHCHCEENVIWLLESECFRKHNSSLIKTFEKAKEMMSLNKTGDVII